ncbi:VOC family protein [Streptomyces sp. TRM66268-LWL]|uniref:VOC family protein n=1 Tax=Streptomyces polyasparticus TaxID=2767826 RepID=A0ABR7SIU5_9ACTN|nr:VOC family protein [Streptomyces polyasparticus]MBC9715425.1 VOC family protein [Streptomyces polyasparticus]
MPAYPLGAPCWVDAMFPDLDAAKSFYSELLGWTYAEGSAEFGGYTQAFADGKAVAAVVPQMPGMEEQPPAWSLYLATPDIEATAEQVKAHGGTVAMDPMQVGEFGSMLVAQDPGGVFFSAWQPGAHQGFEKVNEPGAFCWAEVTTRAPDAADAFFPAVFGYNAQKIPDPAIDFMVWDLGEEPVLGRFKMTDEFPPEIPSHINIYFVVPDCDAAVDTVRRLGGQVHLGPMGSPFGRFATVADPQGASFSVIDVTTMEGEMPEMG